MTAHTSKAVEALDRAAKDIDAARQKANSQADYLAIAELEKDLALAYESLDMFKG